MDEDIVLSFIVRILDLTARSQETGVRSQEKNSNQVSGFRCQQDDPGTRRDGDAAKSICERLSHRLSVSPLLHVIPPCLRSLTLCYLPFSPIPHLTSHIPNPKSEIRNPKFCPPWRAEAMRRRRLTLCPMLHALCLPQSAILNTDF